MAEVESALHAEGMVTTNMVLPGHDPGEREKVPIAWKAWTEAVSSELAALKQKSDTVFLVGHSFFVNELGTPASMGVDLAALTLLVASGKLTLTSALRTGGIISIVPQQPCATARSRGRRCCTSSKR